MAIACIVEHTALWLLGSLVCMPVLPAPCSALLLVLGAVSAAWACMLVRHSRAPSTYYITNMSFIAGI